METDSCRRLHLLRLLVFAALLLVVLCVFFRAARIAELESDVAELMQSYGAQSFSVIYLSPVGILWEGLEAISDSEKLELLIELRITLGSDTELYVDRESRYFFVSCEEALKSNLYRRAGLYFRQNGAVWFILG